MYPKIGRSWGFWILLIVMLISCTGSTTQRTFQGEELAVQYCGSCHRWVPPNELPRQIWTQTILPHMGHRLGIYQGKVPDSLFQNGLTQLEATREGVFPSSAQIDEVSWAALQKYYVDHSLQEVNKPTPEKVGRHLEGFSIEPSRYTRRPPLTTLLRILPEKQQLIIADGKQNVNALLILDEELDLVEQIYVRDAATDFAPWQEGALLLSSGPTIYPIDFKNGQLEYIYAADQTSAYNQSTLLMQDLRRPVHVAIGDLNKDQEMDFVVAEFGNQLGQLSLFQGQNGTLKKEVLIKQPGAVKSELIDLNADGWTDVLTLMSQGREGFYYFQNDQGRLKPAQILLEFSPLAGSSYFEMADFNADGLPDILYTCGDNADQSPIVKKDHGIYIFLNQGDRSFVRSYFFHLPGAYKAMARDFDKDGDLDIAAISFFPDYGSVDPVSFVYLRQQAPWTFVASTFPTAQVGRWITMDVGDLDGDNDIDIALGSFVRFYPMGDTTGLFEQWVSHGPAMVLLRNKIN